MTLSGDEGPAQAITVLLVEDDAPTCWRLQDALAKQFEPEGEKRIRNRGNEREKECRKEKPGFVTVAELA